MDVDPIDGSGRHRIPQMLKSRTDERRAAVPLIDKTVVRFEWAARPGRCVLPAPPLGWQWSPARPAGRRRREHRGQHVMPACSFTPDLFGLARHATPGRDRELARLRQAALHLRKQPLESFGKPSAAVPGGLMTHPHPQRRGLLIAPGHRRLRQRLDPHLGVDAPSTAPHQSHRRNTAAAACAALSPRDQTAVLQDCWRGDYEPLRRDRRVRLEELRTGDGRCLPVHLKAQISRELDRLEIILVQLKAVESERDALLAKGNEDQPPTPASLLVQLKGIGPEFAAVLWSEGLYRGFNNRRQVAAYAGLAPTPWQSGSIDHEQGVSKAGNSRLRTTMIQLAWLWLQHQPGSALSIWFRERVQRNGGRGKKTAIVAMARKLLIALWKYAAHGVLIEGAVANTAFEKG